MLDSFLLLAELVHAMSVYTAAALSTPPDDGDAALTNGRRLATMLKALACFDAALRNQCERMTAHVKAAQFAERETFNASLADLFAGGGDAYALHVDGEVIERTA